jgi:hypothetical protein
MSKLEDLLIRVIASLLQRFGPALLQYTPIRRMITGIWKRRFLHRAKHPNPASSYPAGVQVDLAVMGVAIVNSVDRILDTQNVSP